MEAVGFLFKRSCMFLIKYISVAFVFLFVMTLGRIGYCYWVASSSAEQLLPQVARYVAEDNGLVYDISDSNFNAILGPNGLFANANLDGDNSKTHQYYFSNDHDIFKNGLPIGTHEQAIKVYKADDTTKTNICESTNLDSSNSHRVVQRGELLIVEITAYATVNVYLPFIKDDGSIGPLQEEIPVTKSMAIPAVKYYRGLGS